MTEVMCDDEQGTKGWKVEEYPYENVDMWGNGEGRAGVRALCSSSLFIYVLIHQPA